MNKLLSFRTLAFVGLSAVALSFSSCSKDDELEQKPTVNAPETYNFQNVSYGGQTVRMLLLKDLEAEMEKAKTQPVLKADLMAIFENSGDRYAEISTGKKLSDKMATPADKMQVEDWFAELETLSNRPSHGYVNEYGVDVKQMVAKTIMGSVFYNRALNDYLDVAKLSADDNNSVTPGTGTAMEHHFDEGFGYFGAARNFNQYTDAEIVTPGRKDANGDGDFDVQSEVNFYYAQTAAKRDMAYTNFTSSQTDFTKEIFTEMLKGRHAITQKQYTQRDEAVEKIRASWDKMLAATVIHYAGEVKTDINNLGTNPTQTQLEDRAKHWSEMKAYFNMIRYNQGNKLGAEKFNTINELLGPSSSEVTVSNIDAAVSQLKAAYNF